VVELKKEKCGCVNIYALERERIITDVLKFQTYSRLMTAFEGSLLKKRREVYRNQGLKRIPHFHPFRLYYL
jgi:hypothetical protein